MGDLSPILLRQSSMTLSSQELAILAHLKSMLKCLPDSKRQIAIANYVVADAQQCARHQRKKEQRERYLKHKAEMQRLKPHYQLYAKLTLNVGDIVLLRGTRDQGLREIVGFLGTKIICYKLVIIHNHFVNSPANRNRYVRCGKTNNDLSNVLKVKRDDEWISITYRDIVN
jgi:hypothetical protein